MKFSRLFITILLGLMAVSWFTQTKAWKKAKANNKILAAATLRMPDKTSEKMEQKAVAAKAFVKQKGYNEQTCFLIDMSLPSGQERFFIYDLKKDSLKGSGLVAHGNCFEYWLEGRRYSNVVGSGCTSLGKYKIGNSYHGKFGYSFKLHGLDSTNNNAFERTVVLHSHSCVPETETTDDICQSNGCPTLAPGFYEKVKSIINKSGKPVLLWIYD